MANTQRLAYQALHFCILLWGFTAPIGKILDMPALDLVWIRMTLAALSFVPFLLLLKQPLPRQASLYFKLIGVGFLVALHWLTFYGAIKLSNASVTLVAFSTTSLFTSVLEPLFTRQKPHWRQVLPALMALPGIAFIANELPQAFNLGLWVGLLSALLCSIFGVFNKILSHDASPLVLSLVEMIAGATLLTVILLLWGFELQPIQLLQRGNNMGWMLFLVLGCTTLPFFISFWVLRHLSAFTTALALNLEPVYGILIAVFFFHENQELPITFFIGALFIISALFVHSYMNRPPKTDIAPV